MGKVRLKFALIILAVLFAGLAVPILTGRKTCEEITLNHSQPIPATIVNFVPDYESQKLSTIPIQATVDMNVYSDDGRAIILPAGTLMLGFVNENINKGRVFIKWYRFIRPDGFEFTFMDEANRPFSGDSRGRAGIPSADGTVSAGTRIKVFSKQDLSAPCKMRPEARK